MTQASAPLVAIPAWNEAANLPFVIGELRERAPSLCLVVIDDGSTDGTAAVARGLGVSLISLPFHLGYGAAFQTGVKFGLARAARAVVTFDADGQHDPRDIEPLLGAVNDGADLAVASRRLAVGAHEGSLVRRLGRALFATVVRRLTGLPITDPTSGMKALGPRAQRLFALARFPDRYPDADALILAHRAALRVVERPARMRPSRNRRSMHSPLRVLPYCFNMALSLGAAVAGAARDLEGE